MPTPSEEITTALANPKKAMVDGNLVEMHDLDNQVKAAEYLDKKNSQTGGSKLGIARYKIRPGGSL